MLLQESEGEMEEMVAGCAVEMGIVYGNRRRTTDPTRRMQLEVGDHLACRQLEVSGARGRHSSR